MRMFFSLAKINLLFHCNLTDLSDIPQDLSEEINICCGARARASGADLQKFVQAFIRITVK